MEDQQTKFGVAIAQYLNCLGKPAVQAITPESIHGLLKKAEGNFLSVCGHLIGEKRLSIESNLDEVAGLCKAILKMFPNEGATSSPGPSIQQLSAVSKDPMEKMTAWPTQEKRETGRHSHPHSLY